MDIQVPVSYFWNKWTKLQIGIQYSTKAVQVWVDDVKKFDHTNLDQLGTTQTLQNFGVRIMAIGSQPAGVFYMDDISVDSGTRPASSGDTTPPTTPTNLTATAISYFQINLSWTVSTDNVGVTCYRIYRCTGSGCTPSTQINTSATNSYSDTGLSSSTTYVYRVAACDAAGNVSGQSASASATTQAPPDTTPPAAPTGVTVN
jgi:hypothetical protein